VSDVARNVLCGQSPDPSDKNAVVCALARKRWLTFNRFLADLWVAAGDNREIGFSYFGLLLMRDALECDRTVPESKSDVEEYGPRDLLVETASIWVNNAGEKMYHSKQTWDDKGVHPEADALALGRGGPRWSGANGYCPERWSLWKQVFTEVAGGSGSRQNAVIAAKVSFPSIYLFCFIKYLSLPSRLRSPR